MDFCPRLRRFWYHACQRVGRASELNLLFCACAVQLSRSGRALFSGISTIGGGAFRGYMPAGQERMRAEPLYFALSPLNFHGVGVRGGASLGRSLPSAAALLAYACQRIGRANILKIVFCACAVRFSRTGGR